MSLATGTRLGPYEILAPIGAGGMGEVYRARDIKLGRDVAIKVLPEAFAHDADRMARFEREAKVLASLNHPNIATIYGVEEHALVMELVEGVSPKGPLPFDEAWKIAMQIADALEYAHEKGVIHRDLKPANVKVTPEGVVKLLDFGLAKAFTEQTEAAANPERSPTLTIGATEVGVILGTAAFMAPEQAKGKRVDKRADIWAFGVVLYELLTGERPFKGEDVPDTLAQVLTKEPDLAKAPRKVQKLLCRCLEKDPKKRLRDIGEARYLLEEEPQDEALRPNRSWAFGIGASIASGVLLIALGILSFVHFRETLTQRSLLRSTIVAPEDATNLHGFALSPDGRFLAMATEVNGKRQLWLRALDAAQAQALSGSEDATYPFWSPDSRYIGFFAQHKLKKIAISGGPPQTLCDALAGRGGSWSKADVIVFSPRPFAAIQRMPASGGPPADVISSDKRTLYFPTFLPDGNHFLYVALGTAEENGTYLASLDGKENRRILPDISSVAFAAGRLLFIRENTLMAQAFDITSARTAGEVFPVVQDVSLRDVAWAPVTVSDTGVLLYEGATKVGINQLAWYDRGGKLVGIVGSPSRTYGPAISPDASAIVFQRFSEVSRDLWLRELSRGTEQRLTGASFNSPAVWSPKGDHIVFSSIRGRRVFDLYQRRPSATGLDELLLATERDKYPLQWSADGQFVVYSEIDSKTTYFGIWVLPMADGVERKPAPFLQSESSKFHGQLSPDSRWMAYTSEETGQRDVYVRPFPHGEDQTKISLAGGEQPRWRGDGRELFFLGGDGKLMAVAVKATDEKKPSFEPLLPEPLFETRLAPALAPVYFQYDVTADGKRFLLNTIARGQTSASPMLNLVVNWDAGLKK